ncbi:MAG: hypothetical protein N3A59_02465 [Thermodesulfovibrionales bacterium]|nr:hypothetical protein [Thermodesulfovibrionales bacterium]
MTIFSFQVNEANQIYTRLSKLKPTTLLEKEPNEPQDIVNISAEAKKRQILEQARQEALEKIRQAR